MLRRLFAVFAVLAALCCFGASAQAATAKASTLEGKAFTITVFAGDQKILDKLTFTAKDLTASTLGFSKVAYATTPGDAKHKKDISFTAQITDGDGNLVKLAGTVSGNEVNGTIERIPKKGDAKTLPFSGGKAGPKK